MAAFFQKNCNYTEPLSITLSGTEVLSSAGSSKPLRYRKLEIISSSLCYGNIEAN